MNGTTFSDLHGDGINSGIFVFISALTVRYLTRRYIGEYKSNTGMYHMFITSRISKHFLLFSKFLSNKAKEACRHQCHQLLYHQSHATIPPSLSPQSHMQSCLITIAWQMLNNLLNLVSTVELPDSVRDEAKSERTKTSQEFRAAPLSYDPHAKYISPHPY